MKLNNLLIVILACFFFLACNTEHKEKQLSAEVKMDLMPHLHLPPNCKADRKFNITIPANKDYKTGPCTLLVEDFDANERNSSDSTSVHSYGTSWAIINKANDTLYNGYSEEMHYYKDDPNGAMDEWVDDKESFNDTIREDRQRAKDKFTIFPLSIDTLIASPDGKYIAVWVGQEEANPILDIIDASNLLNTGHYKVLKKINPHPGDITRLKGWKDGQFVMESNMNLVELNKQQQFNDSDKVGDINVVRVYGYNMDSRVFTLHSGNEIK